MKTIAIYANTCALGSYKELWPKAFYQGLQQHRDWKSTYVTNKQLTDAEYAWCFSYQVKGDVKQSDNSHRSDILRRFACHDVLYYLYSHFHD